MKNEKRLFREGGNSIDTGNLVSQVFLTCLMGKKTQKSIINIEKVNGYKANVIFEIM